MLPHIDDEVVVAFENGDTRRPIVIGAMFNGKDKPGEELLQEKKGSFAMVSTEKGFMHTKDDFTIKSDKKMVLTVETDREEKVKRQADDRGHGRDEVQVERRLHASRPAARSSSRPSRSRSRRPASLKLKGATVDIEGSGPTSVKGATLDLNGSGMVNVKGAIINLG